MHTYRRPAIAALAAAGLLWGTTVPLSRLALEWLPPAWLTFARFAVAAAVLLVAARSRLRGSCTPAVLAWGAVGYGGTVLVQNAGITRTSVSHAALLIGAAPVLVAIIAALWHHTVARPVAWAGFAVSLAGVGLVAGLAAARPRPGSGDRRAVPGRGTRRAAGRRDHGGHPRRSERLGRSAGDHRAGDRRHAAALHAVRLRAEPGFRRGCRSLPQPRAARRRRSGRPLFR